MRVQTSIGSIGLDEEDIVRIIDYRNDRDAKETMLHFKAVWGLGEGFFKVEILGNEKLQRYLQEIETAAATLLGQR